MALQVLTQPRFLSHLKGSLEPGKLADFVVIDRDLTNIRPKEIRKARIMRTVVDGKVVFERNANKDGAHFY